MKKKVIWCISKYATPPKYGYGARLYYIAKEFIKFDTEVLLIGSDSLHLATFPQTDSKYNYENIEGVPYLWIKTRKFKKTASIQRLVSWIDFEHKLCKLNLKQFNIPDVVIISSLSLLTINYGLYIKKKYNCKLVFEIRDIHPLYLTEEFGVSKWNPYIMYLRRIEKKGYRKSDLIVGTMPNLKQHVYESIKQEKNVIHSPIGIPEIWQNGIVKNTEIDKLFPTDNKFIVGYAGSMGVSNNLEAFIQAIKEMSKETEIHFVLVGSGDLREKYIEEFTGYKNVTIGPRISQKDIPYFLSKCDVLYLSGQKSKVWDYGQSLTKLIDYMMASKPVIASYSGYESMLNEANSGTFIPVGESKPIINSIMFYKRMNKSERDLYGLRGRKWVLKNRDYSDIAKSYYDEINKLFDK